MHIFRVCIRNGYSVRDLDYLFNCLILSLFTYCIRVCGVADYTKYLSQIDRLLRRAFRFKVSATLKIAIFTYFRFQRFQIDMLESFL